jgi:hypothetical protein
MKNITKTTTKVFGVIKIGQNFIPKGGSKIATIESINKVTYKTPGVKPEYTIELKVENSTKSRVLPLNNLERDYIRL